MSFLSIAILILLVNLPYVDINAKHFSLKDMKDYSIRDSKSKPSSIIKSNDAIRTSNKLIEPNSAPIPSGLHAVSSHNSLLSKEASSPQVKTAGSKKPSTSKLDTIKTSETFNDSVAQTTKSGTTKAQKSEVTRETRNSKTIDSKVHSKEALRRNDKIRSPARSKSPAKAKSLAASVSPLKEESIEDSKLDQLYNDVCFLSLNVIGAKN